LTRAEQDYLRAFAGDPRFPAFDRLAHARGFDELALMELESGGPPVSDSTGFYKLWIPKYSGIREVAYHKTAQAALLLSEGKVEDAETTLRQTLSVGLLLTDDGTTLISALVGRVVGGNGLDGLRQFYAYTGQLEKLAQVQAAETDGAMDSDGALGALGNLPTEEEALLEYLSDPDAIRAYKWESLSILLYSHTCADARGLLLGIPRELESTLRGPVRQTMVRYPGEGDLFDAMMSWAPRAARQRPGGSARYWETSASIDRLRSWGWWAGQVLNNDRLSACFLLF
jgi:hypothetical protein